MWAFRDQPAGPILGATETSNFGVKMLTESLQFPRAFCARILVTKFVPRRGNEFEGCCAGSRIRPQRMQVSLS